MFPQIFGGITTMWFRIHNFSLIPSEEQFNFALSLSGRADIFIENNKCSSTCIQSDSWLHFFPIHRLCRSNRYVIFVSVLKFMRTDKKGLSLVGDSESCSFKAESKKPKFFPQHFPGSEVGEV